MKKYCTALALIVFAACSKQKDQVSPGQYYRPTTETSKRFISKVYEYFPAPGQFVNESVKGDLAGAQKLVGSANALLSLGSYGGYVIFGFDHSVDNKDGYDIGIYGNPLVNKGQEWSEAGIVMVMQDLNGNGLPDDNAWYELAGSEYNKSETIKRYRITYYNPKNLTDDIRWKDNQGKTGYVLRNPFHNQAYYPTWVSNQDSLIFEGTLLKSTLVQENDPVYGPGLITNKPFEWGYSDSGSPIFLGIQAKEGRGYNVFDITNAVDADGRPVKLTYIDFVRVYTGQNCNGDPGTNPNGPSRLLGEVSTEVAGAMDMHLPK